MSSLMTFFRKLITSKRLRYLKDHPEICSGVALFLVLALHGSTIGLTDDEAYYWVLAQKPAMGYAYHPPMVAWSIAFFQWIFHFIGLESETGVVRLPAILSASAVLTLTLQWMREVGVAREKIYSAASVVVSLAGLFALSWMIVPDLPMFLGWILMFRATWWICFNPEKEQSWSYLLLFFSGAFSLLSKYSAVFMFLSSFLAVLFWAPRQRVLKTTFVLFLAGVSAAIPIVLWNYSHEWASILYQIRDRHEGGSLSLVRWARFWIIEFFGVGPFLLIYGFKVLLNRPLPMNRLERFVWLWAAPPVLVFGLQPLWSDFKPHWALVAWWPFMLLLAIRHTSGLNFFSLWQRRYGLTLAFLVLFFCHVPVVNALIDHPKLDVTNDLYGWRLLKGYLKTLPGNENLSLPVIGSRYQTASQAYFALGPDARVSMLPRDIKARDEWPALHVSETEGPDWSRLNQPVLFVGDNRYDAPPEFPHAKCGRLPGVRENRGSKLAKEIYVWRCEPLRE